MRYMRSSYLVITTLTVLAVLFVASSIDVNAGSYSFAANGSKQKSLSLTIQEGGIVNAGPQKWTMSGGILGATSDTATPESRVSDLDRFTLFYDS